MAPAFRRGEKYNAASCCPVSLTCICCRALGHVVVSNISRHLAFGGILAGCRHGFRCQRSCKTQLVRFYRDSVSNLNRAVNRDQRQTHVVIIDFARAFDRVPQKGLFCRLEYCGMGGSAPVGSACGSLGALGGDLVVESRIWSRSCLGSPRGRSWGWSCFSVTRHLPGSRVRFEYSLHSSVQLGVGASAHWGLHTRHWFDSARVCGSCLASLSWDSDGTGV